MRVLEYEQLTDSGVYEARYYAPNVNCVLAPDGLGGLKAETPTSGDKIILDNMFEKGNGHAKLNGAKPTKVYKRRISIKEAVVEAAISERKRRATPPLRVVGTTLEASVEEGAKELEEPPKTDEENKLPVLPVYQWKGLYPTHRCFVR